MKRQCLRWRVMGAMSLRGQEAEDLFGGIDGLAHSPAKRWNFILIVGFMPEAHQQ